MSDSSKEQTVPTLTFGESVIKFNIGTGDNTFPIEIDPIRRTIKMADITYAFEVFEALSFGKLGAVYQVCERYRSEGQIDVTLKNFGTFELHDNNPLKLIADLTDCLDDIGEHIAQIPVQDYARYLRVSIEGGKVRDQLKKDSEDG